MPMDEAKDIIAAINTLVGDDKAKAKEFAKDLRTGARDVAQSLINIGGSQKQESLSGEITTLKKQVEDLTAQLEHRDTEMAELRAKTPDAQVIEDKARQKWEKQVRKAETERDDAQKRFNDAIQQVGVDKAVALLITPNEQGVRVHPDYAKLIAAQKLRPYIVPKADGSFSVRQIGEQDAEYDGDTLDTRIAALVKDFRAEIPADFQLSNADGGAGVRNGGGSGGVAGPKKSIEQIIAQKMNDPAFAGM